MPRQSLVLNAGPLLTFLCLNFLDEQNATKAERDQALRDVRNGQASDQRRQDRMGTFFRANTLLTTSHAMFEVFRLREGSYLERRSHKFLSSALASAALVEERAVLVKDLVDAPYPDLLLRYGLADGGVVWLATREACEMVTDDGSLYRDGQASSKCQLRMFDACLD